MDLNESESQLFFFSRHVICHLSTSIRSWTSISGPADVLREVSWLKRESVVMLS